MVVNAEYWVQPGDAPQAHGAFPGHGRRGHSSLGRSISSRLNSLASNNTLELCGTAEKHAEPRGKDV